MPNRVATARPALDSGRDALQRCDWDAARASFRLHVAAEPSSAEGWEGLASACYWLQEVEAMFEARRQAYEAYSGRGDVRAAARVATWLASDFLEFRAEAAVAAGWLERASQLLEGLDSCLEHAWLEATRAHIALAVENDAASARASAVRARELARSLGDTDMEMLARAVEGVALVASGSVAEGMRRLDGAAAAALGGDMADLNAISVTCCYVIQACERVRDVERALEWCRRFRDFSSRWRLGSFQTFCRLQYGTMLLWRGEWEAAEAELAAARDELQAVRAPVRAAALVRLGELRRRQGRWEEAAALLEEARAHRLAPLWRAALALDQGDTLTAEDLARQALRRSGGSGAERATALELLTRAQLAQGSVEEAAATLAELETLAAAVGTDAVRAAAIFTAGAVARARGADEEARRAFRDAADLFEAAGSPFEAGCARLELGRALLTAGRRERGIGEVRAAVGIFDGLGATRQAAEARELLQEAGLAPLAAQTDAGPLTRRQREVLRLVAQGLGNREIGDRLVISEFTVRRHLSNIYTRLGASGRTAAVAQALRDGLL